MEVINKINKGIEIRKGMSIEGCSRGDEEIEPLTAEGYSRAGHRTILYIPELDVAGDCGVSFGQPISYIFSTHGHSDHTGGLHHILECCIAVSMDLTVVAHKDDIDFIRDDLRTTQSRNDRKRYPQNYQHPRLKLVGMAIGDVFDFTTKTNMEIRVETIECVHRILCVGFGFSRKTKKLKEEYKEMPGPELGKLRKSGVPITEETYVPEFVYMGDTQIEGLTNNETILAKYPVIITECTFIDGDISDARSKGHTHWEELKPYVLKYPNTKFILIHFSLRYKPDFIRKFFADEGIANVEPFCEK